MEVPGAKDIAVEFFTLSKSYNMPGWRVGFMVGNKQLVSALARIKSYFDYGTFTPIQVASIAALEGPQDCVREIVENYKCRRDVLVPGLNKLGWPVELPKATMFAWARIPEQYRSLGSMEFSKKLLLEAEGRGEPGDWVWRTWRWACAVLADRERGADSTGASRNQADVQSWLSGSPWLFSFLCLGVPLPLHRYFVCKILITLYLTAIYPSKILILKRLRPKYSASLTYGRYGWLSCCNHCAYF